MEIRKEFFRQLGLPRHEVYEWAKRSLKMPNFSANHYREKRHQLRQEGYEMSAADKKIFEEIKNNFLKIVHESGGEPHPPERARSAERVGSSGSGPSNHSIKGHSKSRQRSDSPSVLRTPPPPPPPMLSGIWEEYVDAIEFPYGDSKLNFQANHHAAVDLERIQKERSRMSPIRRRSRSQSPIRRNSSPVGGRIRRRLSRYDDISNHGHSDILAIVDKRIAERSRMSPKKRRTRSRSPMRRNASPGEDRSRRRLSRYDDTSNHGHLNKLKVVERRIAERSRMSPRTRRTRSRSPMRRTNHNLNTAPNLSPSKSPKWETMLADIDDDDDVNPINYPEAIEKPSRINFEKPIERNQRSHQFHNESDQRKPSNFKEFMDKIERQVHGDNAPRNDNRNMKGNHFESRQTIQTGGKVIVLSPKPQRVPRNHIQNQITSGQNNSNDIYNKVPERQGTQPEGKDIIQNFQINNIQNPFDQPFPPDVELENSKKLMAVSSSKFLTRNQQREQNKLYIQIVKGKDADFKRSIRKVRTVTNRNHPIKIPLPNLQKAEFWDNWWQSNAWIKNHLINVSDKDLGLLDEINIDRTGTELEKKKAIRNLLMSCEKIIVNSLNNSKGLNASNAYEFLRAKVRLFEVFVDSSVILTSASRGIRANLTRLLDKPRMIVYYLSLIEEWKNAYECSKHGSSADQYNASKFLQDKVLNWLVGLAFDEIQRYSNPITMRVPKETKLKELFNQVCQISNNAPDVRRIFYCAASYKNPNNVVREKIGIINFFLENKPKLKFKKIQRFMIARILLSDVEWDKLIIAQVKREKDEILQKVANDKFVGEIYESLLNKMIRGKIRIEYLKSIYPRLKCLKDRKGISMLANFLQRIDVQYMCKFILVERMKRNGSFLDPIHKDADYFEIPNSDEEDELEEKIDTSQEIVQCRFCIKTFKVNVDEKFFINVCQTEEIPAPKDVNDQELTEILQSDDVGSFRIPMSISDPRTTKDKSNNPVDVCDIAVNPKFFVKCQKSALFKEFFLAIVSEALSEKYNIQLRIDRAIVLNNRKFIGTLVPHRVRNTDVKSVLNYNHESLSQDERETLKRLEEASRASGMSGRTLVQEISDKELNKIKEQSKPAAAQLKEDKIKKEITQGSSTLPEFKLRAKLRDECVKEIQAEFYLPKCISSNEITLDIGEDRILLESMKHGYLFDKFVNYRLKQELAKAIFDKANKMLQVRIPIFPVK